MQCPGIIYYNFQRLSKCSHGEDGGPVLWNQIAWTRSNAMLVREGQKISIICMEFSAVGKGGGVQWSSGPTINLATKKLVH